MPEIVYKMVRNIAARSWVGSNVTIYIQGEQQGEELSAIDWSNRLVKFAYLPEETSIITFAP